MPSPSLPTKRIGLATSSASPSPDSRNHEENTANVVEDVAEVPEEEEDNCIICLQAKVDRTVLPSCSHEFCFECIAVWCGKTYN